ncbi:MAG TPA: HAD family hydrolase [Actinomycetota bacterium]
MTPRASRSAALLDVDGTLVDTNYQHTVAWLRAFRYHGVFVPAWRIHRHIGMGGDHLVAAVAGQGVEDEHGDSIRDAEGVLYRTLIHEAEPLPGARDLLRALKAEGHTVVLASSAKEHEMQRYLDVLDAREVVDAWTTSADVDRTKPDPDLVHAALERAGTDEAVFVGDTRWDCEAAARAAIPCVALLCGGFGEAELIAAGAVAVFDDPRDLLDHLDEAPFDAG